MDLVAGKVFPAERRPIRHIDPALLVAMLLLIVSGLFMVYSATHQSLEAVELDPGTYLKRQSTFAALGIVIVMLMASFDYRFLRIYAGMIYGASIALLLLVRTPLGTTVKGSQRWFELFGFQLTPSELTKIALIVMLATYLAELRRTSGELSLQHVYAATAIAAIPAVLVFLQPDLGTSIVLVSILVGILVVAGARGRHLGILALTAIVLIFGALQLGLVRENQIARIPGFLDPVIYEKQREMTVTGALAEPITRTVGDFPYRYPVVDVDTYYLWAKPLPATYPYYYDPFWYDPWYPHRWYRPHPHPRPPPSPPKPPPPPQQP